MSTIENGQFIGFNIILHGPHQFTFQFSKYLFDHIAWHLTWCLKKGHTMNALLIHFLKYGLISVQEVTVFIIICVAGIINQDSNYNQISDFTKEKPLYDPIRQEGQTYRLIRIYCNSIIVIIIIIDFILYYLT